MKITKQETQPLHIENTVNSLSKRDLQLPQAFHTYRSMLENEYIGAGIGLTQSLINKLDYHIDVDTTKASKEEIKLVEKLNASMKTLRGITKTDFLNYQLSCIPYGVALSEIVMKRDNGLFVFDTFSPIHPINVNRYTFEKNTLTKIELNPADNDGQLIVKEATQKTIQGDKILMVKLNPDLDNPLGRSVLNRCYMPWKKLEIVGEYELIGIAKNLSGVLKIKAPAEYIQDYLNNASSDNAQYLEDLIGQAELLHAGKSCLAVIASDTNQNGVANFDITTIGNSDSGDMDINAITKRLENSILTTLYSDILMLGQSGGGSFALSDSKTALLGLVIDSILNTISSSFEHALKVAYEVNGLTYTGNAKLVFESVEQLDFEAFTRGLQRLVDANIVEPDEELETFVRKKAKLSKKDSETKRDTGDAVADANERKEKEK